MERECLSTLILNWSKKIMTISIKVKNYFHQRECPLIENKLGDKCNNEYLKLAYLCSRCVQECLKCMAPRLNANSYTRGCEEARQAEKNVFPCVCSPLQGCEK